MDPFEAIGASLREARFGLACGLESAGRLELAANLIKRLLAESTDDTSLRLHLARCYLELGCFGPCRELLEGSAASTLDTAETRTDADLLRAALDIAGGRVSDALACIRRSEDAARENSFWYAPIGLLYLDAKVWTDAERALRQAIEFDATSTPIRRGLAVALWQQGRFAEAAEQWFADYRLANDLPAAYLVLGLALFMLKLDSWSVPFLAAALTFKAR